MIATIEKSVFSIYGVSIEHPTDWQLFFDPKRGFNRYTGFFRIEDFVPKKGAQISLTINWEKASSSNESFAHQYCENVTAQYNKQFKKAPHEIISMDVIDFNEGKAAYIVSEYKGSPGLMKKKSDPSVKVVQLAFYDETSGRAVVGSVMGHPNEVLEKEEFLKDLLFTLKCT